MLAGSCCFRVFPLHLMAAYTWLLADGQLRLPQYGSELFLYAAGPFTMDEVIEWMVLSQISGIGVAGFWRLVGHLGSPVSVLQSSAGRLKSIPGVSSRQLQGMADLDTVRYNCIEQYKRLQGLGGECLLFNDTGYPERLRHISDPPPLLYCLGNKDLLQSTCIGVVGSRASTSYGNRTAFNLCRRLAASGVTIVSGLALGIDSEAHRGALAAEGKTIGVLGCGVDVVYPRSNRNLFEEMVSRGTIISEYPLATSPEGFRFPARNRIIAGISSGVIVVEAARKSGSLITAQLALDEGRDVYAVPGQVDSYKSEGTHLLLQQGAKLVQSERDVLEDLGFTADSGLEGHRTEQKQLPSYLDEKARELLQCLESYPLVRDELLARSGIDVVEFSEILLLLELDGLVEVLPGDEIRRLI